MKNVLDHTNQNRQKTLKRRKPSKKFLAEHQMINTNNWEVKPPYKTHVWASREFSFTKQSLFKARHKWTAFLNRNVKLTYITLRIKSNKYLWKHPNDTFFRISKTRNCKRQRDFYSARDWPDRDERMIPTMRP